MIRLLLWLVAGHIHHWKILSEVRHEAQDSSGETYATGRRFYLQCETCGDVKKRTLT